MSPPSRQGRERAAWRARACAAATLLAAVGPGCGRRDSSGSRLEEIAPLAVTAPAGGGPGAEHGLVAPSLPEDTLSVTLLAEDEAGGVIALGVRDWARRTLVDAVEPESSTNRMLRGRAAAVAMLPSASASLPLGPEYRISAARLDAPAGGSDAVTVRAFVKRAAGDVRFWQVAHAPPVQRLPVSLFLVGARLPDDDRLLVALNEAGRVLRAAGLELDEPVRLRLTGDAADRLTRLQILDSEGSGSPDLADLVRLPGATGVAPAAGLAIFVVDDIEVVGAHGSGPILGITAGIPVPPVSGSVRSGIAVNGAVIEHDPISGGQVLAHEIGHALGLYHVSEADGTQDQIDDTREDDEDNLMHWTETRGAARLSPEQGDVLRRAPLAR